MDRAKQQDNLRRLMNQRTPDGQALDLATNLPLSHGMSGDGFRAICRTGSLYSQKRLVELGVLKSRTSTETSLGTDASVFFFVGPFAYPNTNSGFLFKATLEKEFADSGFATPFDTGGLLKIFKRPDPTQPVDDFFAEHTLPLVAHRNLLALTLHHSFAQPQDYLLGTDPIEATYVTEGDRRRWTHEVQIQADIPIHIALEAVFFDRYYRNFREVMDRLKTFKHNGVAIRNVPRRGSFKQLVKECTKYLKETYL